MSGKATAAVHRPAMSSLLQRILSTVMDWFRNWLDRRSLAPLSRPPRRTVALESLEPRLLLSADLVGSISAAPIPDDVLPSDKFNVSVIVRNVGAHVADVTPVVRLYASNTGKVDSHSIALGESSIKNSIIRAGQSVNVNVTADASRIDDAGNYSLFAVVDATNKVRESNENNNVAVAGKPLHVVWSFGQVPGHSNTDSITLTDACGTRVTFTLTGGGRGDVVLGDDGFDVHLKGTNANSSLKITTSGGNGHTTIDDLLVDGSLKQIDAAKADLAGQLSIGGTVRSIVLGDIGNGAGISIAGTGVPVKLVAGGVVGANLHSASAFESISIEEWVTGAAGRGTISAPSIGKLTVDGAFGADLDLSGAAAGLTLSTVEIEGRITGGLWNIGGAAGQISAKSIESVWQGSFEGAVQKIATDANMSGTLATPSIGTLDIGGSMVGAKLLIGANLGNNGVLNRSATPADHFGPGQIGELRVDGTISNSSILVGVDPVDGIYGNGNDILVGGAASRIQLIVVGGKLLGSTSFIAGAFPTNVKINGQTVKSANVAHFHTTLPDTVAPQISAALVHDSGASATDGVTNEPPVAGQVTESGAIATFSAALDSTANASFVSIKSRLQPNGSFVLDAAALAAIGGGPLSEGAHTLYLRAVDGSGNASATTSVAFVLDTLAPSLSLGLDPASDSGIAGDQLTRNGVITLSGETAAGATVELLYMGRTTTADASGKYSFDNIAMNDGILAFGARATDLAGNEAIAWSTVSRDSIAPVLTVNLLNDTGASNSDRRTSDPSLAAHVNDFSNLVSITLAIDDGPAVEQQPIPAPDFGFVIDAAVLDGMAGGRLSDGPHTYHLRATDAAGNVSIAELDFILERSVQSTLRFDLAPESDTGIAGDQRTALSAVTLLGIAEPNATVSLAGTALTATADATGVFWFANVALVPGDNVFTMTSVEHGGNEVTFTRTIVREDMPQISALPDLAVVSIDTYLFDGPPGEAMVRASWITMNLGSATAHGQSGYWIESLFVSMGDTIPFNNDQDYYLGSVFVSDPLDPGTYEIRLLDIPGVDGFAGGTFYVVVDDGNQVFEKASGEYNNTIVEYRPPALEPPIAPSEPELSLSGGTAGGSIAIPGETDIYTFGLTGPTRLVFDALTSVPDMQWEVREVGGAALFGGKFLDDSGSFWIIPDDPLFELGTGFYEVVISNASNYTGDYGFRLLDVAAAARNDLFLDGGALLGQVLPRGDQTDVYQFDAAAGQAFIVGGPGDNTFERGIDWRLYDPEGHQIWTSNEAPSDVALFQSSGTYTLLVEGRYGRVTPTNYNVYVFTPQDRDIALTTGQRIQGFLDAPGQVNTYHFTLDEATVAFFDADLGSNGPWFDWVLEGPDGLINSGNTWQESDQFGNTAFMNLDAGAYTLRIQGQGDASGWYNFGLFDLVHDAGMPLAVGQPATGVLAPGFSSALYRFDAGQGQDLEIALYTMDRIAFDPVHWYLVDADGNVVSDGQGNTSVQLATGEAGSYSLLIQGRQFSWTNVLYAVSVASADQPGVTFDLAPESDTGVAGDRATTDGVVTLVGTAAPFAHVSLEFLGLDAIADETGAFAIPFVYLSSGENAFIVRATDSAGNSTVTGGTIFQGIPAISVSFDLAPESDTGSTGDHHTTLDLVSLAGVTAPFATVSLLDTPFTVNADAAGQFRFDGIALELGANLFTVLASDGQGNATTFARSIVRDEASFPDLVVSGIQTEVINVDQAGWSTLRVSWTTSNTGPGAAVGRNGAWAESVHLSYDDTPWNGDSFLGNIKVTGTLAAGASEAHYIDVFVGPGGLAPGYRVYVVTDDEQAVLNPSTGNYEYFANEVAEKDVGEFNDLAIQDVSSGFPPAPIAPAAPGPLLLDGTAVGGSIGTGESTLYTFHLDDPTRLYFDSLSESPGMAWTLRVAGGIEVVTRSFAASDAFGIGAANPLLNLQAGNYELIVSNASAQAGDYGFRLLDPGLADLGNLVLDGVPVSRATLERGNWTDIYQFEAAAGTRYVAGGPNDWAVDGALYWRLFDPQGNQIWTGTTSPSDEQAFTATGTYTLMVEGRVGRADSQQYSAYVFTPQDRDIALTTGQRIQGFLDSPGQVNTYHFTLDEATVAFFDGYLESNGPYFNWTLQGPGGIVEGGSTRSDTTDASGNPRLLNLAAGDYSLTIEGVDNAAGWYNFALFDLVHDAGTPISVGQPVIGALLPGFNSTLRRFDGAAGQALTIELNTMDQEWISYDPVHWLVVDSAGNTVAQGQVGTPVQATLTETGSYSLLIQAHQFNWTPVLYSLSVAPPGQASGVPIDLAPESDTGTIGDQRTDLDLVTLAGVTAPGAQVTLEFLGLTTTADETGAFEFEHVLLQFGVNPFIVRSVDTAGNESIDGARIIRDFVPPPVGEADLAASNVASSIQDDGFGNLSVQVSWTTTNIGTGLAAGPGFWNEAVYYSPTDSEPSSGDDVLVATISASAMLDPGFSQSHSVSIPASIVPPGGHFYVVVDDGNLVVESPAGEFNNVTMEI